MFVLTDKPTFKFEVTVNRPDDATGKWAAFTFLGEFKRRTRAEVEDMVAKGMPKDAEVIATEFVGWSGVNDPQGKALEVNDGNRTVLLAENGVQAALVRAWLEAVFKGPAKN